MSSMQEELGALKAKIKTTPTARSQTTPACTKLSPNKCVAKPGQKIKKATQRKKPECPKSKKTL